MKRNSIPTYHKHGQRNQARAIWTDASGKRRFKLLPGPFDSLESKNAFARLIAEVAASPTLAPATQVTESDAITVTELLASYADFAATYYRSPDGKPTNELKNVLLAIRSARLLYGDTPAKDFGPLKLKVVREQLIKDGIRRVQINKRIGRIVRAFRWATSEELVPPHVFDALRSLPGLRAGRTNAVEGDPVRPVSVSTINETLPLLPKHVRPMVELLACTGMRPGEVCTMTLNQIERGSAVWTYRPQRHKTSHVGKSRTIPLGPRGKEILSAFLGTQILDPNEPIFSPKRAHAERMAERSAKRKTPRWESHLTRNAKKRKAKPKREPGTHYTPETISHAVTKAIKAENDRRRAKAKAEGRTITDADLIENWNPYRLRHTFATRVRKSHGLEAAQVLLGHSRADVTQVYAERNEALAAKVAAEVG